MDGTFAQSLEAALGALCPACGDEFAEWDAREVCSSCLEHMPDSLGIDTARDAVDPSPSLIRMEGALALTTGLYQGSLRQLILRAKATPQSPAWRPLYQRLRRHVLAAGIAPQWITVPPPSWKRRWQGWHLAAQLAQQLAQDLGCQFQPFLRRKKQRPPQAGMGAHARRENVRGTFALAGGVQHRLPPSLWLLDDVWTTGATYLECQRVLSDAGVHVHGAILVAQVDAVEQKVADCAKISVF